MFFFFFLSDLLFVLLLSEHPSRSFMQIWNYDLKMLRENLRESGKDFFLSLIMIFFFYIINICRIFQFDLYFFFLKSLCTNTFNSCSASCWPCRVSTWIWMSTQVLLSSSHERLPWPLFSCCSSAMAIFPVCLVTHWKRCWKKNAHA